MFLATAMISENSAFASGDCGTCMFISSPSKSALYGDVTLRLSRKVEYGRIRTLWHIIDILCRDGWRLNRTRSPFCRCLSTCKTHKDLQWARQLPAELLHGGDSWLRKRDYKRRDHEALKKEDESKGDLSGPLPTV